MIKKLFALLFISICLSGCCSNIDNRTVIKFSTWGSESEMRILKPIIRDFEQKNPDIKIEIMHIPQNYFQKLHMLFASNLSPDVVFINNISLPVYEKFIIPQDENVDKSVYFRQAISALSYNGKLLAIPRDVSNLVIYYNKDLFNKYGIKYPNKNWTLKDLLITTQRFKKHNVLGISYDGQIYYALPYISYFGSNELCRTNSSVLEGVNFYRALAYKYNTAPTPAQTGSKTQAQMFLDKQIAMHLSGRWMVPKYRSVASFDWDVVNFPACSSPCDASGWAVTKASRHKEQAVKFILFLSDKNNIEKMTRDGLIVPARRDVAYSDTFLKGKLQSSKLFLYSVENSKVTTVTKDYNKLTDKLNEKYFCE